MFDHPVVDICPLRTYSTQKKTEMDLEKERIATFLFIVEEPEDAISGTLFLSIMRSLLIFAKLMRKYDREGLSSQNCIFGCLLYQ